MLRARYTYLSYMRVLREIDVRKFLKPLGVAFGLFAIALIVTVLLHSLLFGPAGSNDTRVQFVISPDESIEAVGIRLEQEHLVRHGWIFQIAYVLSRAESTMRPGGYLIAPAMDAWSVAQTLGSAPYLAWVTIPPSARREEIAEALTRQLSWTESEKEAWLIASSATTTTFTEGVYFPDIYLIPSDQSPEQIVARLESRFTEAAAPYIEEARAQNLEWSEVLTLASLIERESAKNDKALVAGILWNRLNRGMLLQVDATLQYIIGTSENNWWPAPSSEDKYVESPYNTYQHAGLPPAPIATPSLASIEAVLHPEQTTCLYYLHDNKGRIHCSNTYKAHLANVKRYLR